MNDRIYCPKCGGWMESVNYGFWYFCDACGYVCDSVGNEVMEKENVVLQCDLCPCWECKHMETCEKYLCSFCYKIGLAGKKQNYKCRKGGKKEDEKNV